MAEEAEGGGEKTEDPTPKRLEEAHGRGDVAKSQEVPVFLVLLAGTLLVATTASWSLPQLARPLAGFIANAHDVPTDGAHLVRVARDLGATAGLAVGLPILALALAAAAGNLVQHRVVWSLEPLKPKLSKIDPLSGLKRLFSKESLVHFVKGLVKVAAVTVALAAVLWPARDRLDLTVAADPRTLLPLAQDLLVQMMGAVVAVMAVIAAGDFFYQRLRWLDRQRMTVREVKEEHKQSDGSPEIKAKVKQIRTERSRRRMMQQVPKATVVIANPTHFAVALRYEQGMAAPLCVAKGVDATALRIRALAEESGVAVVENPPLARVLHAAVDVDDEVPPEHYKAVAQVIGYVLNLRSRPRWTAG